jgi:hypothetical protein
MQSFMFVSDMKLLSWLDVAAAIYSLSVWKRVSHHRGLANPRALHCTIPPQNCP